MHVTYPFWVFTEVTPTGALRYPIGKYFIFNSRFYVLNNLSKLRIICKQIKNKNKPGSDWSSTKIRIPLSSRIRRKTRQSTCLKARGTWKITSHVGSYMYPDYKLQSRYSETAKAREFESASVRYSNNVHQCVEQRLSRLFIEDTDRCFSQTIRLSSYVTWVRQSTDPHSLTVAVWLYLLSGNSSCMRMNHHKIN